MNTDKMIEDDLEYIEAVRPKLAAEMGLSESHQAVQAGVEALAKYTAQDLEDLLNEHTALGSYVSIQDSLRARIRTIRRKYGIR